MDRTARLAVMVCVACGLLAATATGGFAEGKEADPAIKPCIEMTFNVRDLSLADLKRLFDSSDSTNVGVVEMLLSQTLPKDQSEGQRLSLNVEVSVCIRK